MIEIRGLYKSFGANAILKNLSLEVKSGEAVAVIGPSGSGKSTLLRCVNGLETFERGEVVVDQTHLHLINSQRPSADDKRQIQQMRLKVGMVFQHFHLFAHMTALQNIMESPVQVLKISAEEARERATALLEKVGLSSKAERYPDQLSGGESQRVAIARSLAMQPKAMLFDEPTSSLDPEMTHEVKSVIQTLVKEGMTTLIATHEMRLAQDVAHRVVVLDAGEIIESATPEEIFGAAKNPRTQTFLSRIK